MFHFRFIQVLFSWNKTNKKKFKNKFIFYYAIVIFYYDIELFFIKWRINENRHILYWFHCCLRETTASVCDFFSLQRVIRRWPGQIGALYHHRLLSDLQTLDRSCVIWKELERYVVINESRNRWCLTSQNESYAWLQKFHIFKKIHTSARATIINAFVIITSITVHLQALQFKISSKYKMVKI